MPPDFEKDYKDKFGHPPVYHRGPKGGGGTEGITERVGRAIKKAGLNQNHSTPVDDILIKKTLLLEFKDIYTKEVPYSHLQAWPIARDWLRKNLPETDEIRKFLDKDCEP